MERPAEKWLPQSEDLMVVRGFVAPFADQLVEKSKQPHIRRWTPRDASERFKDLDSALERVKNNETHLLVDVNTYDVGGVIWYGRKEPPIDVSPHNPSYTFAIRLYESYQGQGLARPFMRKSLSDFLEDRRLSGELRDYGASLGGIWLDVDENHQRAITRYKEFGYQTVGGHDDRLVMVLSIERILEIFRGA